MLIIYVIGFEKTRPASTHNYKYTYVFRNTDFNYLKYVAICYNLGRETDIYYMYLHEICHDFIALNKLSIHQLLGQWLAEFHAILDSVHTSVTNTSIALL